MKRAFFRVSYSVFSLMLLISTGIPPGVAIADPVGMPSQEELKAKIRPQLPSHLEMTEVEMSDVKTQGNAMLSTISANLLVHASLKEAMYRAEGMRDGTDAVADWAILNALVNVAGGASWVG